MTNATHTSQQAKSSAAHTGRKAAVVNQENDNSVLLGTDESRVVDQCLPLLARDLELFQRCGSFVRVGKDDDTGCYRFERVESADLRRRLTNVVRLQKQKKEDVIDVHPPTWLVNELASHPTKNGISQLRGITTFPILRSDGSLNHEPGYDQKTRFFYAGELPVTLMDTSKDAAVQAFGRLGELIVDFPMAGNESRAVWFSLLLSVIGRHLIDEPVPLHLMDANIRGSGKGLLINAASTITSGRQSPTQQYGRDDEEIRKMILSVLMAGRPLVHLDNIESGTRLGSPSLDSLFTSECFSDRLLKTNEISEIVPRTVWVASGNNLGFRGDTGRRTLRCRLESHTPNPEDKNDWQIPKLLDYIREKRAQYLADALTILAAYLRADQPSMGLSSTGNYHEWSDLVRSAIVWVGGADCWQTVVQARDEIDDEAAELESLIRAVEDLDFDGGGFTLAEATQRYKANRSGYESVTNFLTLIGIDEFDARKVGLQLRKHKGRPAKDGRLISNKMSHGNTSKWFVKVNNHGGHGGYGGHVLTVPEKIRSNQIQISLTPETCQPFQPCPPQTRQDIEAIFQ